MLGLRHPMKMKLVGDAADTLDALLPLLRRKRDRAWQEQVAASVARWWRTVEERSLAPADPLNPQRMSWELSSWLPDGCMLSADTGTSAIWFARNLWLRCGMRAFASGTLASMGKAVPYAIALVGDGAMQMSGLAELLTVATVPRRSCPTSRTRATPS